MRMCDDVGRVLCRSMSACDGQRYLLFLCGRRGAARQLAAVIMNGQGKQIVELTQGWIGTPYRHQGATRGVGCDCIGLISGVWREFYGRETEVVPAYALDYALDWAERSGEERLLDAARQLFGPALPIGEAEPGDLLLFRWRADCAAKHAGIDRKSTRLNSSH